MPIGSPTFCAWCTAHLADERTEIWLQSRELSRFRQRLREQIGECKQKALNPRASLPGIRATVLEAMRIEMRCLLNQRELLETQRQDVEVALAQLMAQLPQHITWIPGIGPATGATILAEIGNPQRFDSVEKLVAYAGIDATVYQSGQFAAAHTRMSKRGSPYLRQALWQAAGVAIQNDPKLKAFYARKRAEGKAHGTALGAICRKLLARIFVVLKQQRPYIMHWQAYRRT